MRMEVWKDITGYEGRYKVSSFGRLKSLSNGKWGFRPVTAIIIGTVSCGYRRVQLRDRNGRYKGRLVHRLVAEAFIPNPENKPCINHIDGDKANNHIDNLEWCTYSENNKHAFRTGLKVMEGHNAVAISKSRRGQRTSYGGSHGMSKLSENDVLQIRSIYEQGWFTQAEIGRAYNVDGSMIGKIVNRNNWTHI